MSNTYRCGCLKTPENTAHEAKGNRCLACKREYNRERMRCKRLETGGWYSRVRVGVARPRTQAWREA